MRHTRALTVAGSVRTNTFGVRQLVILIVVAAALVWGGIAFAQEAYVSHRLSQQVADLRRQNAEIEAQNAGYKKDVKALQSGTADEEEARMNGYARPNERLYLVTAASPSPSPPASPSPSPSGHK
ncbi:MAG TPA: septum formation initiator family protein [Candidatus Dormibacteraeota bacterium]|nr:septum formation initiator family protein [Candidatus Dormibacteraeota bacterium]